MNSRNRFIDSVKGLCIFFVLLLHFPFEHVDTNKILFPYWAALAVPCFMFISGYVSSLSFGRKGYERLKDMYSFRDLVCRLVRFIIPFTIAFAAQWVLFRIFKVYLVNIVTYGLRAFCVDYLTGGKGPGSYYFPIMIQFVFLFPIVYVIIRKFRMKGLVCIFIVDEAFEILAALCGMNESAYRLLVFRYLFVIAAGVYYSQVDKESRKNKLLIAISIITSLVGALFIWLFSYSDFNLPINHLWSGTSALASLFIVPILGFSVMTFKRGFCLAELFGKASFNIFLVQMIYFTFYDRISVYVTSEPKLFLLTIVTCGVLGILFYLPENRLTKWVVFKIRSLGKLDSKKPSGGESA